MTAQLMDAPVRMTAEEYFAAPGLSNSGMTDLAVSPLRFWYRHIRPDREPEEPTTEMKIGSALHCAVLEPDEFDKRYACEVTPDDFPGCLRTIDEMRQFLRAAGESPKGTRKSDIIVQIRSMGYEVPIFDLIQDAHQIEHAGKTLFKREDWDRIRGCAESLLSEPKLKGILSGGEGEVAMFAADKDAGVRLKGRLDWVTPKLILDIKTFSQKRGKSIDRSVTDALFYENYLRQAYLYALLRGWPKWDGDVVFAFVESEPPHEVRLRALRSKRAGQPNLFWQRSHVEVRGLIYRYAEYSRKYGTDPWRDVQDIDPLADEEMPQLAW
jgi:hypothetical protein